MFQERKISTHFISLSIIVCVGLFFITSIFGIYYVYSIKRESAIHVAKVVEGMLKSQQYREAIYSLSNAKLGSFDAIGFYDSEKNRIFVLPPSVGPEHFEEEKGFLANLATSNISVNIFFDEKGIDHAGTMIFTYNHLSAAKAMLLFYIVGIAFILPVLYKYKLLIRKGVERDLLAEKNRGIKETVKQVWHDLNQPMQLLYALVESGRGMNFESKEKIKNACDDMRSILDDLKEKRDYQNNAELSSVCLAATLKEIVEIENVKLSLEDKPVRLSIQQDGLNAFAIINENKLKRMISNLIENAAQASTQGQEILVVLKRNEKMNIIQIIDKGHGIKAEHLPMIGKRGVSFRKNGNGLGISYAIEKVESWGGSLTIDSRFGEGTLVEIQFTQATVPEWFTGSISLENVKEFVLTDDRPVIHTLVRERLERTRRDIKLFFHYSSRDFDSWYSSIQKKLVSPLFVFDYDMGEGSTTGLDIIQNYDLSSKAILLTNFYDDLTIQTEACNARVKIFPKCLIEYLDKK
jgi:hypothetical protein